MSGLRQLYRQPLLHFLLLGALIFAAYGLVAPGSETEPEQAGEDIIVTQQQIDRLIEEYHATWQRPPGPDEKEALIDGFIREEILVREALRLGLDQGDTVIRRRLAQKMHFLATSAARSQQPAEQDLKDFYAANEAYYRRPGRIAFEQVFLGPAVDEELVEELRESLRTGANPEQLGKRTLLPFRVRLSEKARIEGLLGEGAFERLEVLPLNEWQGPVKSGYGAHLVRVTEYQPPDLLSFDTVREDVVTDWTQKRAQDIRADALEAMRQRYRVVLPEAER
ncbi:peptidyl-prolyl cis-trans isomerase [Roseibium sp.]|uniref:peptidylprolyl isomerase n=1 Tax=Roseibium sp. TaxID=1936156 RepID=UPI003BA9CDAE